MPRRDSNRTLVDVTSGKRFAYAAAILTLISTGLLVGVIVSFSVARTTDGHCSFADIKALNATCLRKNWGGHASRWQLEFAFDMADAVAAFCVIPAVLVVADIFRRAKQPSFVLAPAFIIASVIRILELTFRAGINMQADYMASTWELSDEAMRTLTVSYMIATSQGIWVFAMDYLFVGMGMLAASMCAFRAPNTMPKSWAWLGLVGGLLGVINFLLELGRLGSWMLASEIAGVTMGLLGFIILPIWLIILGCSLTKASMNADSGALMGGGHEDDDGMELASAAGART